MTTLIFLAVLSVLVLVHELGHFLAAKITGVEVEEFGLGFPPRAIGVFRNSRKRWKIFRTSFGKISHTIFSLNWIPLGGFVRLRGEDGQSQAGDNKNFINKTASQRFFILIAGVTMNFLLAAVIFGIGLSIGWPQATDNLPKGATVTDQQVIAIEVVKNLPAEKAGLKAGDAITKVNNQTVDSVNKLRQINNQNGAKEISYQIKRDGQVLELKVTPQILENQPGQYGIGVALAESGMVSYFWPRAIWEGFKLAVFGLKDIAVGFWQLLAGLFSGQNMSDQVAGPVGIAVLTGQVSRLGWLYLLQFVALLSLNLAFINILPLPALDGGRLLFIVCEKIAGRPVKANVEAIIHSIGFILLMAFVAFITLKDIIRLF